MAKAIGTLKATSLKLVPKGSPAGVPVQFVFAVEHDLKQESGKVVQGDVAIGKALAKLTGTYNMHGETTSIHTKLNGQAMPVDDLEGMLPALGVVLPTGSKLKGGTLSFEIDSNGPLNKLVSTGWVKMSNTALAGFSLMSKLSAISALGGKQTGNDTEIENLSSDVRNAPEGTRLDKINLVVPSLGTVTGAGTISPAQALNFKMLANLAGAGAGCHESRRHGCGRHPRGDWGHHFEPNFHAGHESDGKRQTEKPDPYGERAIPWAGCSERRSPIRAVLVTVERNKLMRRAGRIACVVIATWSLIVAAQVVAAQSVAAQPSDLRKPPVALHDLVNPGDRLAAQDLHFDASFAQLALEYLRSGDSSVLERLGKSPAATHLLNHARNFDYDVPKDSPEALVAHLLTPPGKHLEEMETCEQSLAFFSGPMLDDPHWVEDTWATFPKTSAFMAPCS